MWNAESHPQIVKYFCSASAFHPSCQPKASGSDDLARRQSTVFLHEVTFCCFNSLLVFPQLKLQLQFLRFPYISSHAKQVYFKDILTSLWQVTCSSENPASSRSCLDVKVKKELHQVLGNATASVEIRLFIDLCDST